KRLLQAAAVIGKDVPYALLQAIAEQPEDALRQGLARLQAAEFLYETSLFPHLEYTFKHALTHEVVYGSLLQERPRALHARIVEALETLYVERLGEHVEQLAEHALRGEVWDKAMSYGRQAGAKSAARPAYRQAIRYFEQALDALEHLPARQETSELGIDIRLDLRNVLMVLLEQQRVLDYLTEAEALAMALQAARRLGSVSVCLSLHYWQTGGYARAVEVGERALALATARADLPLQVRAIYALGPAYHLQGNYRAAVACLAGNARTLQGDLARELFGMAYLPAAGSRSWMAQSLAELGESASAVTHGEDAVRLAEAIGHPFSVGGALYGISRVHLLRGDLPTAIARLERTLAYSQEHGLEGWWTWARPMLGYAYALAGQPAEALPLLEPTVSVPAYLESFL